MTEYVWQPIGNTDIDCNCERYGCGKALWIRDNLIGIQDLEGQGNAIEMVLEDGITVCERVPAPQASVPVDMVRYVLGVVRDAHLHGDVSDTSRLRQAFVDIDAWLDSQRPQGQEDGEND